MVCLCILSISINTAAVSRNLAFSLHASNTFFLEMWKCQKNQSKFLQRWRIILLSAYIALFCAQSRKSIACILHCKQNPRDVNARRLRKHLQWIEIHERLSRRRHLLDKSKRIHFAQLLAALKLTLYTRLMRITSWVLLGCISWAIVVISHTAMKKRARQKDSSLCERIEKLDFLERHPKQLLVLKEEDFAMITL